MNIKTYYKLAFLNLLTLLGIVGLILSYWFRPIKNLTDHLDALSYEKTFYFVEPYYQIVIVLSICLILLGISLSIRLITLRKIVNANRKFIRENVSNK